jgi:hypothetical protein
LVGSFNDVGLIITAGTDIDRFGTVHITLQLLPPLSMLFLLTTAAGSALFHVKLDQQRRLLEAQPTTAPEYADDPV